MSSWNLDHTSAQGRRLQKEVDCSWGYTEFIRSMVITPTGIQDYKDMWAERGLTAEVFEEHKTRAGCTGPQCSDPNTVWNKEGCEFETVAPVVGECYCICKNGYTHDGEKCVKAKSGSGDDDTTAESPPFSPGKILLGVGIGTTLLVAMSLMMGGEKNDESS